MTGSVPLCISTAEMNKCRGCEVKCLQEILKSPVAFYKLVRLSLPG